MRTLKEIVQDFQTKAYTEIPSRIPSLAVDQMVDAFFEFLKLPQAVRDGIHYRGARGGSDVGYMQRPRPTPDEPNPDQKEYFHYHESADARFQEQIKSIPALAHLIACMKPVYFEAKRHIEEAVQLFDGRYPGTHDSFFPAEGFPHFYLRIIAYRRARNGESIATPHYDAGSLTLAIKESAPGLEIGFDPETLQPIAYREDHAILFPGISCSHEIPAGWRPAWHGARQRPETVLNDDFARWAVVLFADGKVGRNPSWQETHTPIRNTS